MKKGGTSEISQRDFLIKKIYFPTFIYTLIWDNDIYFFEIMIFNDVF